MGFLETFAPRAVCPHGSRLSAVMTDKRQMTANNANRRWMDAAGEATMADSFQFSYDRRPTFTLCSPRRCANNATAATPMNGLGSSSPSDRAATMVATSVAIGLWAPPRARTEGSLRPLEEGLQAPRCDAAHSSFAPESSGATGLRPH